MTKVKNPFKYPIKTRAGMIEYITEKSRAGHYSSQDRCWFPFSWNVKLNNFDQTFKQVVKVYIENMGDLGGKLSDPAFLERLEKAYEEKYGEDYSSDITSEQQEEREYIYRNALDGAQSDFRDGDAYTQLWDGTDMEVPDESRTFFGRQSGYAGYRRLLGYNVTFGYEDGLKDFLNQREDDYDPKSPYEVPFSDIRKMYKFVVEMDTLLSGNNADSNVMYYIASRVIDDLIEEME